jgi:hypothetical protein
MLLFLLRRQPGLQHYADTTGQISNYSHLLAIKQRHPFPSLAAPCDSGREKSIQITGY